MHRYLLQKQEAEPEQCLRLCYYRQVLAKVQKSIDIIAPRYLLVADFMGKKIDLYYSTDTAANWH